MQNIYANQNAKIIKLIAMQRLTDDVQKKTEQLKATLKQIQELNEQHAKLTEFYENEWLSLCDDHKKGIISQKDLAYINEQAQSQAHSVLSEDGIWNVLADADAVQLELIKQLVKHL